MSDDLRFSQPSNVFRERYAFLSLINESADTWNDVNSDVANEVEPFRDVKVRAWV